MKIISGAHRIPGIAHCSCGTIFEFDYNEINQDNHKQIGMVIRWYNSISCPVCRKEIELPDNLDTICPWKPDKE